MLKKILTRKEKFTANENCKAHKRRVNFLRWQSRFIGGVPNVEMFFRCFLQTKQRKQNSFILFSITALESHTSDKSHFYGWTPQITDTKETQNAFF